MQYHLSAIKAIFIHQVSCLPCRCTRRLLILEKLRNNSSKSGGNTILVIVGLLDLLLLYEIPANIAVNLSRICRLVSHVPLKMFVLALLSSKMMCTIGPSSKIESSNLSNFSLYGIYKNFHICVLPLTALSLSFTFSRAVITTSVSSSCSASKSNKRQNSESMQSILRFGGVLQP